MSRFQSNAIRFVSTRNLRAVPLLSLVTMLSVIAAGCTVATTALPELPPAPTFAAGTFQVNNNFAPCPAGSTPSNPGASLCTMTSPTGTIDVITDAFLGSSYTATITTRGGTVPVTSCQIQGSLPGGMVLNAAPNGATCVITGTLASTLTGLVVPSGGFAAITLTIRATDSSNPAAADTQDIVIRIFSGFSFTTLTIENGTQARAYNKILTTDIGAGRGVPPIVSCTATGLPAGMTVGVSGATSCVLGGTPTVNGNFTVTVTATDSAAPANVRTSPAYSLVINPPLTVTAPSFTNGTQGRPYIALTVDTAGGQRPIASCSAPALPPGMTIAPSAGNTATNVNTCTISGTPTASGSFTVVVSATDIATPTTAAGTAAAASAPLLINPPLIVPAFVIGNSTELRTFALTVPTAGGNRPLLSCSLSGAPAGLTIAPDPANTATNVNNCILGGAPNAGTAGNFNITVTVGDTPTTNTLAGNASSAATALQNNPVLSVPVFTFQTGAEGIAYTKTIPTAGGNRPLVSCNATGLAAGLNIALDPANTAVNVNNCIVSGTPNVGSAGPYTVVVTVGDTASTTTAAGNASSANTGLTINGPLNIPPFVLGNGTQGRAFSQDVPVTGGIQPVTICTISAGALPAGLAIAVSPAPGNCRISGTPTGSGAFNITVQATDTGAPPGTPPATATSASTPLTINAPLLITTTDANVLDGVEARAYSLTFANTGGQPGYTWSSTGLGAGACSGLTMSAAGVLSGTTTVSGLCNFTASVTDTATTSTAAGTTTLTPINLTVRPVFIISTTSVVDGVEGRNYGLAADTCGGVPCVSPILTTAAAVAGATDKGSAENGNGPLTSCSISGVLPAGGPITAANFTPIVDPANQNRCLLQSSAPFPLGSSGTYTIVFVAQDTPIAAVGVPVGNMGQNVTIKIQPALTFADQFLGSAAAGNWPDAVTGRTYGDPAVLCGAVACVSPTFTAAGGIPPYNLVAGVRPAGIGVTVTSPTITVRTFAPTVVTGVTTTGTYTASDAGNTAVPGGAAFVLSRDRTITVQAAMVTTPNAAGAAPPPAVVGREYGGTSGGCSGGACSTLTYTVAGGLSGYTFTGIASVGAPGLGVPNNVVCSAGPANVLTCGSSGGTGVITAAVGGPYTFNVNVADTNNATTPSGTAPTVGPLIITVNAAIGFAGISQGDPLAAAVNGRPWGDPATLCKPISIVNGAPGSVACVGVTYTATGGLGGYAFVTPPTSGVAAAAFPSGFGCATVGTDFSCFAAAPGGVTGAAGTYANIPVTVNDTPNLSTPSAVNSGTSQTALRSLVVNPALTYTANVGSTVNNNTTPPSFTVTNPDGVLDRTYGKPGAANDLEWAAAGGLGNVSFFGLPPFAPPNAFNFFIVPPAGSGVLGGNTVNTTFAANGDTAGTYNYGIFVHDDVVAFAAKNPSTPAGTILHNNVLIVRAPLAAAQTTTGGTAVTGRSWGVGSVCVPGGTGACVPDVYTATAGTGLGGYVFTTGAFLGAPGAAYPTGFGCLTAANLFTCSAAAVTGTAGSYSPSVTVDDTANATTPSSAATGTSATVPRSANLDVLDPLNIPAIVGNFDGTDGRVFNLQIPFTGGNATFTCSATGLPPSGNLTAGFGGVNCQITGTPLTADVGAFSTNVTVTDSPGTSAPSGNASTGGMAFNINAALTITTTTLNSAVTGIGYSETLVATGGNGAGGYTFNELGGPVLGVGNCTGFTPSALGGITGVPPYVAAPATCGPFTIQVVDTATVSTAAGNDTQALTIDIVAAVSLAAAPELDDAGPDFVGNGTDGIAFGTGSGTDVDFAITGGAGPFTCAVTNGALPSGLSVTFNGGANSCRITGTPVTADVGGPYVAEITVIDTGVSPNQTSSQTTAQFNINAALAIGPVPTLASGVVHDAVQARAYSLLIPTSGGEAPLTLTNPNGDGTSLNITPGDTDCDGLSLNGAATIIGTGGIPLGTPACPFDLEVSGTATTTTGAGTFTLAHTFTLQPVLQIASVQNNIINGMLGATYPGFTFTATGGTGAFTWFDPADNPTPCGALTGSLPTGLTMDAAGVISSTVTTAASTVVTDFEFQVCVEDDTGNTNAAVASGSSIPPANPIGGVGNAYRLNVMNRYVYTADDDNNDVVHVINSATNTYVDTGGAAGDQAIDVTNSPFQMAVSPHGRYLWVTHRGSGDVRVIDTISHAIIAGPLDLTAGALNCTAPDGIAAERTAQGDRVVIACQSGDVVVLVDPGPTATPTTAGATNIALTGAGTLDSVSIRLTAGLGDRAYFTDNGNSRVYAVDISAVTPVEVDLNGGTAGTHVDLTAGTRGANPKGIVVVPNTASGGVYAYIAMNTSESNNFFVTVWNVTTDTPTNVTDVVVGTTTQAPDDDPFYLAWDSTNNVVYVTLTGSDRLRQINNAIATPDKAGADDFAAIPAGAGTVGTGDEPYGVAIPPISGRVYNSTFTTSDSVDFFDLTAFGTNPTGAGSIDLSAVTNATPTNQGRGAAAIPIPR